MTVRLHRLVRMLEEKRDQHATASEKLEKHDMDGAMCEWRIVKAYETVLKDLPQHPNDGGLRSQEAGKP